MKRPSLIVLLAAVLALAGWTVAQPPAPEGQDPPVRLKRKKRPPQQEPPPKPDKAEQPDPVEDPKKKPDDPPRPKLDEEERLDPKENPKPPAAEQRDEKEILERVARNARLSEKRITKRELGESTRTVQQEILKDIDSLIERTKNQDDQDDQNNQNNQDKPGDQGASGGRQGQQSVSQRRQRRQSAQRRDRGRQGRDVARNKQPNQSEDNGTNPGGGSNGNANKQKPPDRAFDQWGHLPEKERALMQKEMEQKFMEKYDDLTKQYYRIIAEKSRRKK